MYISLTGEGQRPNQASHLNGSNCLWGREIAMERIITVEIVKELLADAEQAAYKMFGFEHKFYKLVAEISKTKKVSYNSKTNTLVVWENDMPIYQNSNGVICRDAVALADCIL